MKRSIVPAALAAAVACLVTESAQADRCTADAAFLRAYPANAEASKWKLKFRVESDGCKRYSCRGYVNYNVHYQNNDRDARSSSKRTLVGYTIRDGEKATEVTDEVYPHGGALSVKVRDADIESVSCTSP